MIDIKSIDSSMVFLGILEKESKKTGNKYSIAKFCHDVSQEVYEFFIKADYVKEKLLTCPRYIPIFITLELSSIQGDTRVDLKDICIPDVNLRSNQTVEPVSASKVDNATRSK